MSDSVQMPALGESVTEGTVTRWLKQVGDRVEVDEPLLEVSTDKVDTEIPSPVAGVVEQILVAEDETVPVGAQLAVIGSGAAAAGNGSAGDGVAAAPAAPPVNAPEPTLTEPARTEPSFTEPSITEPSITQPSFTEPSFTEPSITQPAATAPAATEPSLAVPAEPHAATPAGTSRVQMPALGESVTEGTVTRWLKAVGESVQVDEPLLEVSTDKVDTEIPSPVAGVVQEILVGEDETVPVGADLVVIGTAAPSTPETEGQPAPVTEPVAVQAPPPLPAPAAAPPAAAPPAPAAPPASAAPPAPAAAPPAPVPPPPAPATAPAPAAAAAAAAATLAPAASGGSGSGGPPDVSTYVTPLVRKMAAERGVSLSALAGTGIGGRIRKQDVLDAAKAADQAADEAANAAAATPSAATAPATTPATPGVAVSALRGTTVKMSRLRKVIAQRMVESLQVSAQLTTVVEVDVTKIARLRDRAKRDFEAREGVKLSFLPFFALAAVEALKQFPVVNASIDGDDVVYHAEEHLGVAVDTERGLLVPVIRTAGDLNIAGIARKIADLADRTRNNKITPDELGGGTFTLTNTGSRGALFDTPIINQPQVAILGTGAVVRRPVVVVDGEGGETIAIRSMVYLALSYDHRIVDGADAARFLGTVRQRLEEGAFDADLGL